MVRMIEDIRRARDQGRLANKFSARDLHEVCPAQSISTYNSLLFQHRVGNAAGNRPCFWRHPDGKYSLVEEQHFASDLKGGRQ